MSPAGLSPLRKHHECHRLLFGELHTGSGRGPHGDSQAESTKPADGERAAADPCPPEARSSCPQPPFKLSDQLRCCLKLEASPRTARGGTS